MVGVLMVLLSSMTKRQRRKRRNFAVAFMAVFETSASILIASTEMDIGFFSNNVSQAASCRRVPTAPEFHIITR